MKKYIKTDKYGELYIDRILFESYFPIIFTCKNDKNELFICVSCQNNSKGCKWLAGKTNGLSIVRMLRDEITIRELLLKYSSGKISIEYDNNEYTIAYGNSDWNEDSIFLPKEDSYMFAEEDEFADDISYYSALDQIIYEPENYSNVSKEVKESDDSFQLSGDSLNELILTTGSLIIRSEIKNSKTFKNLCVDLSSVTSEYKKQEEQRPVFTNIFKVYSNDFNIILDINENSFADAA